jgi:hypothetical protein
MTFKPGVVASLLLTLACCGFAADATIAGHVIDMQGKPVADAKVRLKAVRGGRTMDQMADASGQFVFPPTPPGSYEITATARGFVQAAKSVSAGGDGSLSVDLRFSAVAGRTDAVTVSADVRDIDVASPDPAIKVFASEDLLDANPGRPGAPVSIPGYPIETASSGIKAPQYFAPGVAGDHGEPIAQFIQVGGYLVPNNLSANAHGNGYTDPNIFISSAIEAVEVDGGAFNVREGNHALNLATTYSLRPHLDPFFTLTGDQRDLAGAAGFSPGARSWIAAEVSYGNGFLDRLEHRKQVKVNGGKVFEKGNHTVTWLGIGYYGSSYIAGLSPIHGFSSPDAAGGWVQYPDTIDPRQKDQTHTALLALNDRWTPGENQEFQLSGFFRTYNLALYSDFGDGLIRQSEFRTVAGGSAAYRRRFSKRFTLLAGTDYQREAPRRDNLDHYNFFNPSAPTYYGPFVKVDGSNVTISPVSPYVAAEGEFARYFHYYVGWRRDEISIDNQDLVTPAHSSSILVGLNSPKATLTFFPKESWWAPEIAVSFGKSFFTEDPRTGATMQQPPTGAPERVNPVETARSWQLVANKRIHNIDIRVTLGRATQSAEYGKIDADTGLQSDLGPGRVRYVAVTLRQSFRFGSFEATYEQADARNLESGQVAPEAPRLIGDFSWTYQKLPFHLQAKGEFEYVGRKVLGNGCNESASDDLTAYCLGVPNREFRLAVARAFRDGKINLGVNMMFARGYTGQTIANFAADYKPGYSATLPVSENPTAEVVGVRIPSYVSVSFTYRFGR